MISAHLGHFLDKPLSSIAKHLKVSPNVLTITGFLFAVIAACILPYNLRIGGLLIILSGFFDLLDGSVARVNGRESTFGAFLDSVLDRYSDAVLFVGFIWFFLKTDSTTGIFLTAGGMIGTLVISYTKARAEGLGSSCHVGIMERAERIILMVFGSLTGLLIPVMWIMLIFTNVTVIQRIYHVWQSMNKG